MIEDLLARGAVSFCIFGALFGLEDQTAYTKR